jgi:hypothetical protein
MGLARGRRDVQAVQFVQKSISFDTPGIASGIPFDDAVPDGAEIVDALVGVKTAFNAASTNVVTLGMNGTTANDLLGASDVTEGTPGGYRAPAVNVMKTVSGNTFPYVKYTQTGTAATTGAAKCMVFFTLPESLD